MGPLVTDVACGWDHISASIGGAIAASLGADFLCYVTASEHLRHPSAEDVREGVVASKIAAHAADIVKGVNLAKEWDVWCRNYAHRLECARSACAARCRIGRAEP